MLSGSRPHGNRHTVVTTSEHMCAQDACPRTACSSLARRAPAAQLDPAVSAASPRHTLDRRVWERMNQLGGFKASVRGLGQRQSVSVALAVKVAVHPGPPEHQQRNLQNAQLAQQYTGHP